jgi:LacI family transcriptional regulator
VFGGSLVERKARVELAKQGSRRKSATREGRLDIRGVAAHAGVSVSTVSRVVNRNPRVDEQLAERVRAAIRELGYIPSRVARSLVSGRSSTFGVIISDITNPFFPELIQGFEDAAVEVGYETLIGSTNYDLQKMEACVDRMLERKVDGVAVMTFGIEGPLLDRLAERGIPMVFIDKAPATQKSLAISIDYAQGIAAAVEYLVELGHERIAFVSGPPALHSAVARRRAFQAAMKKAGLKIEPAYLVVGDHMLETGMAAAQALLQLSMPPTAIVCSNDLSAIGAMHAVSAAGLKVPQDVSVVGFDDVRFSEFLIPPLTTVRMSRTDIARAAVQLLQQLVEGGEHAPLAAVPTSLIVRQSTAKPKG